MRYRHHGSLGCQSGFNVLARRSLAGSGTPSSAVQKILWVRIRTDVEKKSALDISSNMFWRRGHIDNVLYTRKKIVLVLDFPGL